MESRPSSDLKMFTFTTQAHSTISAETWKVCGRKTDVWRASPDPWEKGGKVAEHMDQVVDTDGDDLLCCPIQEVSGGHPHIEMNTMKQHHLQPRQQNNCILSSRK